MQELKKIADKAIEEHGLQFQDRLLVVPINALRGCQYNFAVFLAKPRTELFQGMTCAQATEVRDYMEKQLADAFMKKLKERGGSNGSKEEGTG